MSEKQQPFKVEEYEWPEWMSNELPSYGSREAAHKAAKEAIVESKAKQKAGQLQASKTNESKTMLGF